MTKLLLLTFAWSIAIYNVTNTLGTILANNLQLSSFEMGLFFAPIVEETLKFIAAKSVGALAIGAGIQVAEAVVYSSLPKLIQSPHILTMLPYLRYGLKWKVLPMAISIHFIWNAFWILRSPQDGLPLVGLGLVGLLGIWILKNERS